MFATMIQDLTLLMVFLLIGFVIREIVKPLQKLFLPSALIGGAVALVLGPQVLGLIEIPESWSEMATPIINIVLTCTMFGAVLNKSKIKTYAGAINLVLLTYFAQMFIGTLVGMGLGKIWTDLPYGWGVMTEFTYWGGHGAGASAGALFEELGVDGMVSIGTLPKKTEIRWRVPRAKNPPTPRQGEVVVFVEHIGRGFKPPGSKFY